MAQEELEPLIKELKGRYDEESEVTWHRCPIWWLASFPKSGNTWIRIFLSTYLRGGRLFLNANVGTTDNDEMIIQRISPVPIDRIIPQEIAVIRPTINFHIACNHVNPWSPLLVKTHNLYAKNHMSHTPCFTAGAVYIIRDPRDLVISYSKHCGLSIDSCIETMNIEYAQLNKIFTPIHSVIGTWSQHVESWLPHNVTEFPTLYVKYERLIENPKEEFTRIINFINIDYDEELIEKSIELTDIKNLQKEEDEKGFSEKRMGDRFFNRGTSGHWKDILTPEQADRIVNDHGEMMENFGYDTNLKVKAA